MENNKIIKESESVRVSRELVEKVRENKKKTGVSVTRFIEDAIAEKLERMVKRDM